MSLVQRELENARGKKETLDKDHNERIASLRRTMDANTPETRLTKKKKNVDELEEEKKTIGISKTF